MYILLLVFHPKGENKTDAKKPTTQLIIGGLTPASATQFLVGIGTISFKNAMILSCSTIGEEATGSDRLCHVRELKRREKVI